MTQISRYVFPVEFNDTTKAYFKRLSGMSTGQEAKDLLAILKSRPSKKAMARVLKNPGHNPILHTTCVTTMLSGANALILLQSAPAILCSMAGISVLKIEILKR